jgi:hypothetical protein
LRLLRRNGAGAVKYRYVITHEGVVDANTDAQATALALACFMEYEPSAVELERLELEPYHVNERGTPDAEH